MIDRTRWYTVADVVEMLQLHEQTVRRWIRDGELPAYSLGRRSGYRISGEDLAEFLERRATGKENAA